jgi:hypothetical protein
MTRLAVRYMLLLAAGVALAVPGMAQERVFSGPQAGERTTPFRVLDLTGPHKDHEVDYLAEFKGAPTVVVFVHAVERSIVPLLTVVDQYGAEKKEMLRTLVVFLSDDRAASQQRLPLVGKSLQLQAPVTLSLDGAEGPGNYGLNRKCMMTVIVAKENRVAANFALTQPGIADAPAVLAAIAKVIGDPKPPAAEDLLSRRRAGAARGRPQP